VNGEKSQWNSTTIRASLAGLLVAVVGLLQAIGIAPDLLTPERQEQILSIGTPIILGGLFVMTWLGRRKATEKIAGATTQVVEDK